ncbi:MAG: hypothetical protein QOJ64_2372 [Acidobacteriota bacterium]|nr:hypothetical protein [Acidobacteriota bacterium]
MSLPGLRSHLLLTIRMSSATPDRDRAARCSPPNLPTAPTAIRASSALLLSIQIIGLIKCQAIADSRVGGKEKKL